MDDSEGSTSAIVEKRNTRSRTTSKKGLENLAMGKNNSISSEKTVNTQRKKSKVQKTNNKDTGSTKLQTKRPDKRKRNKEDAPVPKDNDKRVRFTKEKEDLVPAKDITAQTSTEEDTIRALISDACVEMMPRIMEKITSKKSSTQDNVVSEDSDEEDEEDSDSDAEYWGDHVHTISKNVGKLRTEAENRRRITTPSPVTNPPPYTPPADLLPALDEKLIKKVKKREYVDLTLCLPSFSPLDRQPVVTPAFDANGEPSWKVTSSTPRGKISTLSDWLVGWNTYVRCVNYFYPELARQLFYYQSEVTSMSRLYTFSSVMRYDQTFRTRLSNKEVIRWDYHDNELRSACLIPRPTNTIAADYTSTESTLSYNEPQDRRVQPFCAPQRAIPARAPMTTPFRSASIPSQPRRSSVCTYFNNGERCYYRNCRYDHRCRICQSPEHGESHCPSRHGEH